MERDAATGRRRQKWVSGFNTEDAAEKALTEKLHVIDKGGDAFPEALTVRDYITDHWLPHLRKQGNLRPRTIVNYVQLTRTSASIQANAA